MSMGLACWLLVLGVSAAAADELTIAEPTLNCGTVYAGAPLVRQFLFQNKSTGTIRITDVHTHCGCTTSKLPQLSYRPGEKGTLELEVHTLTQPAGPHTFSAHIEYELNGVKQEAEVQLRAVLVSELMIEPAKLVVPASHVDQHPFTLHETREIPVEVVEARTSVPHLKAQASPPKPAASGGWTRSIRLVVEPGLATGKLEARLDLYTNDPKYAHLQVPFVLINKAQDEVAFSPREVEISGAAGRPLPSSVIVLRSAAAGGVHVESVKADDPAITARWAVNSEGVVAVRVQIESGRLTTATLDSFIHIRMTGPQSQTLDIPVHCKIGE
jgi:hypothetical protein